MFIEPQMGRKHDPPGRTGWIEVVCGCMFSGKTEELIRRLNRALIAKQKVEIFKPKTDTRYHEQNIVSHNENAIRSTPVNFANDILLLAGDCDVVGIDEAQFFDESIVEVCNALAQQLGVRSVSSADHSVRNHRAEQRFDPPEKSDRDCRGDEIGEHLPVDRRNPGQRQRRWNLAESAADRFHL